jgi:hypothetical protein
VDNKDLNRFNQGLHAKNRLSKDWMKFQSGDIGKSMMNFSLDGSLQKSIINFGK